MATPTAPTATPAPALSALEQALTAAIEKGMAMGIAMANKANQPAFIPPPVLEACGECGQPRHACGDKHVKMIVLPTSHYAIRSFRGVILNGVKYLSNDFTHYITVPAKNDIANIVSLHEQNEEELQRGRVGQHYSGVVGSVRGPGDKPFTPASGQGWR